MMRWIGLAVLAAALVAVLWWQGDTELEKTMKTTQVETDLAQLGSLITLAVMPQAVQFQERASGPEGGDDSSLCALLQYATPDDADKAIAASELLQANGGLLTVDLPDWLMAATGGAITAEAGSGIQGTDLPIYSANGFARSPYMQGQAVKTGAQTVVLCLFTT